MLRIEILGLRSKAHYLAERALPNPLQMDTKDKVRFEKGKGVFKMGF
jgi:hypothetical protein